MTHSFLKLNRNWLILQIQNLLCTFRSINKTVSFPISLHTWEGNSGDAFAFALATCEQGWSDCVLNSGHKKTYTHTNGLSAIDVSAMYLKDNGLNSTFLPNAAI